MTYNRCRPTVKSLETGELQGLSRFSIPNSYIEAGKTLAGMRVDRLAILDSTANGCASILSGSLGFVELVIFSHHLVFGRVGFEKKVWLELYY